MHHVDINIGHIGEWWGVSYKVRDVHLHYKTTMSGSRI